MVHDTTLKYLKNELHQKPLFFVYSSPFLFLNECFEKDRRITICQLNLHPLACKSYGESSTKSMIKLVLQKNK